MQLVVFFLPASLGWRLPVSGTQPSRLQVYPSVLCRAPDRAQSPKQYRPSARLAKRTSGFCRNTDCWIAPCHSGQSPDTFVGEIPFADATRALRVRVSLRAGLRRLLSRNLLPGA